MQRTDAERNEKASAKNEPPAPEEPATITWDSPKLRAIKNQWESLRLELEKTATKFNFEKNSRALDHILEKNLSGTELRQLAMSAATLPIDRKHRDIFTDELLCYIIVTLIDKGDRVALVSLLSTRFLDKVGLYYDIEDYLVHHGRKFEDPILIVTDAYVNSKVPQTRREIAKVIRRAFIGLGVSGRDDEEFVRNATRLYKDEKEQLVINPEYAHNAIKDGADYTTTPLFKRQ